MKEHEQKTSVVYPDPNFHIYADPDPDQDWNQNDADPHADPTPSFTHVGIWDKKIIFLLRNAGLQ